MSGEKELKLVKKKGKKRKDGKRRESRGGGGRWEREGRKEGRSLKKSRKGTNEGRFKKQKIPSHIPLDPFSSSQYLSPSSSIFFLFLNPRLKLPPFISHHQQKHQNLHLHLHLHLLLLLLRKLLSLSLFLSLLKVLLSPYSNHNSLYLSSPLPIHPY